MNKITDDDLTLLYYGDHQDPNLAARVAQSTRLSARFNELSETLDLADSFVPPHRGEDYGADVWRRVSPHLVANDVGASNRFKTWLGAFSQPRFSLAGALSIALVAILAFTLGRNGVQGPSVTPFNSPETPSVALAGLDAKRLLTHSVSGHLEQVNLVLTQFANSSESTSGEAEYATDMLVTNRLYRQVATAKGNHQLATFLASLEPLLIEMAYEAQTGSTATRKRMQEEVKNGLLFRVRFMNNQLKNSNISV
jgi:hypothetical protein